MSSTLKPANTNKSKYLPDPALKWGKSPSRTTIDPPAYTPSEDSFTPAQQAERAKLRAEGVNPDLKAEMDTKVYGEKGGGFWTKVAGTSFGDGWIK